MPYGLALLADVILAVPITAVPGQQADRLPVLRAGETVSTEIRVTDAAVHTKTLADSLNNLAGVHYEQGHYEEAESLFRRAFRIWEKTLGTDHPDTARSLDNLSGVLRAQGRFEDAEPLARRALGIRSKVLGPGHPATGASLGNLAGILERKGKHEEAEGLMSLRRAFRQAGARTVISSLWRVRDDSTRNLMTAFYERLWRREGQGKLRALRGAQLAMLARNRKRYGRALPSTWGAFVLSGEWR